MSTSKIDPIKPLWTAFNLHLDSILQKIQTLDLCESQR